MAVLTPDSNEFQIKLEFLTSPVFEMMASLRKCYLMQGRVEWEDINLQNFYTENQVLLKRYYGGFEMGAQLAELAVGLNQPHSIQDFIHWVQQMDRPRFLYYLLGRYLEVEEIETIFENSPEPSNEIKQRIEKKGGFVHEEQLAFAENWPAWHRQLADLWSAYYEEYFFKIARHVEPFWEQANDKLARDLNAKGLNEVLGRLLKGKTIPEQFPENKQTEVVRFFPSYFVSPKFILIWGWGELNLVYDLTAYLGRPLPAPSTSENNDTPATLDEISFFGKALSEPMRIRILSLIARKEGIKAQEMAEKLDLNPATISRHLNILKNCKLITETKQKGHNIYFINHSEFRRWAKQLEGEQFLKVSD